jgi:Zn-dependent alcohol dehydrogenase
VVGSLTQSCGMCARCLSGRPSQCQHPESTLRRPTDPPRLANVSAGDTVVIIGAGGVGLNAVSGARLAGALRILAIDAIGGQKRVQGVNYGSSNFKHDIPMYAELYLQGRMNLDDLVSKKIALGDVNDGYSALKDGSLNRVVVTSFE